MFIAWVISVIATLSALFIGEIMGKIPCNLCWYQRIFMFPLPIILGIALYRVDFSAWRYALPLSVGGAGIAAFHRPTNVKAPAGEDAEEATNHTAGVSLLVI